MRVLKHGEQERKKTCGNCKSEIGYRSSDEKVIKKRHQLIGAEARYILCPVCGNWIITQQYETFEELDEQAGEVGLYLKTLPIRDPETDSDYDTPKERFVTTFFTILIVIIVSIVIFNL